MTESLSTQLERCECCPRRCRINRLAGETGFCRIPAAISISHIGLHFGEEPPISGSMGSGTIFFTGCNLRCVFCQNYQISQEFQNGQERILTVDELTHEMLALQEQGAHNINFVSPSHMICQMADAIQAAKEMGLTIPVVYNTNGYDSVEMLREIKGLVDIYLPDIKYMDNALAKRFSSAADYAEIIGPVLEEMLRQVGHLEVGENGIATRGLLVRHLVLPGQLENSRKCLAFLKKLSSYTCISLMSQYSPQYQACNYAEINRKVTRKEYDEILDYMEELKLDLDSAFIQELESQDNYLPDFKEDKPFGSAPSDPSNN